MKTLATYVILIFAMLLPLSGYAETAVNMTDAGKSIIVRKEQPKFSIKILASQNSDTVWLLKEIDSKLIYPLKKVSYQSHTKSKNNVNYEEWFFEVNKTAFKVPRITGITLLYAPPNNLQNAQGSNFKIIILP